MARHARLMLVSPPGDAPRVLARFDDDTEQLTFGRHAEISLPSRLVSRQQFVVRRVQDEFFVSDQNSTSGTWLDHERIGPPARLRTGSELHAGELVVRFEEVEAPEGLPSARADDLLLWDAGPDPARRRAARLDGREGPPLEAVVVQDFVVALEKRYLAHLDLAPAVVRTLRLADGSVLVVRPSTRGPRLARLLEQPGELPAPLGLAAAALGVRGMLSVRTQLLPHDIALTFDGELRLATVGGIGHGAPGASRAAPLVASLRQRCPAGEALLGPLLAACEADDLVGIRACLEAIEGRRALELAWLAGLARQAAAAAWRDEERWRAQVALLDANARAALAAGVPQLARR